MDRRPGSKADLWRDFHEKFQALAGEEQGRAVPITERRMLQGMDRVLRAHGDYRKHPNPRQSHWASDQKSCSTQSGEFQESGSVVSRVESVLQDSRIALNRNYMWVAPLSHFEIGGDKRISQHLSGPLLFRRGIPDGRSVSAFLSLHGHFLRHRDPEILRVVCRPSRGGNFKHANVVKSSLHGVELRVFPYRN